MAGNWGGAEAAAYPGPETPFLDLPAEDLAPPPTFGGGLSPSAGSSPRMSNRNSMALGLEALPLPPAIMADDYNAGGRRTSSPDPSKSFDSILGSTPTAQPPKKKLW